MTLTKDPAERPSAHQLLSHVLFKSVQPSATLQERITQNIEERTARIAQEQADAAPAGTDTVRVKRGSEAPEWEFSMRRGSSLPARRSPTPPALTLLPFPSCRSCPKRRCPEARWPRPRPRRRSSSRCSAP